MKVTIDIVTITVIRTHLAMDRVYLKTNKPDPVGHEGSLDYLFFCPINTGHIYVKSNFPGIPIELIEKGKSTVLRDGNDPNEISA